VESFSFDFEPWDLTEYVWVLLAVLLAAESVRWAASAAGWRRTARFLVGGTALGIAAAMFARSGLWHSARAMTWAIAGLGILALVWAARAYRCTTRPLSRGERGLLLGLRSVAVLAILVILARPVVRWTRIVDERGTLVLLADDSRSMTIRDVAAGAGPARSRIEQLDSLLHDNRIELERIRRTREVLSFTFDASLRTAEPEQVTGKGPATALAATLRDACREGLSEGRRLVGVLLLTDGGENFSAADPLTVATEIGQAGVPLWAVGLGSELPAGQTRGLTARRLTMPARVAVLNRLTVRGELLALGLAGRTVQVELLFDDKVVDTKTLQPSQARETLLTELTHTPTDAGLHKVTLRATANDLEPAQRTVMLSQFVHVTKEYVQVLYIDRPRYERAAVARSLEAASEIRLTKAQVGKRGGRIHNRLPERLEKWLTFDVLILGDVNQREVYPTQLEAIRDAVRDHRRGLLVIAGARGLGNAAFAGTALADVLPMSASSKGEIRGPLPIRPTLAGLQHPACRLAMTPEETQRLWSLLPAAAQADILQSPKPAAVTLLTGPADQPILLAQEAGAGRSAVLAIDSTWRWPLEVDNGREIHARFWRQLVLWLANRQPSVWVTTNQPRYTLARLTAGTDTVIVEAGVDVFGADAVQPRIDLSGELRGPGGQRQPLTFVRRNDRYEARPAPAAAGEYQVEVRAAADGIPADPAQTAFVVESPDIEMQDATANFELLRQMAAQTAAAGGMFVPADGAAEIFRRILSSEHTVRRTLTHTTNLAARGRWPMLGITVGVLVAEWIIRKRRGLA